MTFQYFLNTAKSYMATAGIQSM